MPAALDSLGCCCVSSTGRGMPDVAILGPALLNGVVLRGWLRFGLEPREAFTDDMAAINDDGRQEEMAKVLRRREQKKEGREG